MVLSSTNLLPVHLTQDFGAHSLRAVLFHKHQFSHHTPLTLAQITVCHTSATSTAPAQNKISLVCLSSKQIRVLISTMIAVECKI